MSFPLQAKRPVSVKIKSRLDKIKIQDKLAGFKEQLSSETDPKKREALLKEAAKWKAREAHWIHHVSTTNWHEEDDSSLVEFDGTQKFYDDREKVFKNQKNEWDEVVEEMENISPSNLLADFGSVLKEGESSALRGFFYSEKDQYLSSSLKLQEKAQKKYEEAKKNQNLFSYYGKHFKCEGKLVKKIDMSNQFPPSKRQYGPSCIQQTLIGMVEAAIYRQTQERVTYSAEHFSTCYFEEGERLDGLGKQMRYLFDGNEHTFCSDFDGYISELRSRYKCLGETQEKFEDYKKTGSTAGLSEFEKQMFHACANQRDRNQPSYLAEQFNRQRELDFVNNSGSIEKINLRQRGYDYSPHTVRGERCKSKRDGWRIMSLHMKHLCAGQPLAIEMFGGYEKKKGDSEWYKRKGGAPHSMIVQGIDWDENGVPYYVIRNTASDGRGKGTESEERNFSLARVPAFELCQQGKLRRIGGRVIAPVGDSQWQDHYGTKEVFK